MTNRVIQTDATPEQIAELVEIIRREYPDPTITHRRHQFTCPSWCVLEHDGGDGGTDHARMPRRGHQGPEFGPFTVDAEQTLDGVGAPTVILGDLDRLELDAAEMRLPAEHANDAAEWLPKNSWQPDT